GHAHADAAGSVTVTCCARAMRCRPTGVLSVPPRPVRPSEHPLDEQRERAQTRDDEHAVAERLERAPACRDVDTVPRLNAELVERAAVLDRGLQRVALPDDLLATADRHLRQIGR